MRRCTRALYKRLVPEYEKRNNNVTRACQLRILRSLNKNARVASLRSLINLQPQIWLHRINTDDFNRDTSTPNQMVTIHQEVKTESPSEAGPDTETDIPQEYEECPSPCYRPTSAHSYYSDNDKVQPNLVPCPDWYNPEYPSWDQIKKEEPEEYIET
jgi:hypothetical protein